jgi:hypothetical protein
MDTEMDPSLGSYESRRRRLQELLDSSPAVSRHDKTKEKEAETLAHAFLALEESFHKFTGELLPKLKSGEISKGDLAHVLHEIGEEFRHILYHIGDPRYYRYLPAWGDADVRDGRS